MEKPHSHHRHKPKSISHDNHRHELTLKHADKPYHCWGCKEIGFGSTYTCSKCKFFLHTQCGKPKPLIDYPFSKSKTCVLKYYACAPRVDSISACDACRKKIQQFHYKCKCEHHKPRYLHPYCLGYQKTLDVISGLTLRLEKEATSKCLRCVNKDRGWAYVSSCGTYCYHLSCVKKIIFDCYSLGLISGKGDPFRYIKLRFPKDHNKMHQLAVVPKQVAVAPKPPKKKKKDDKKTRIKKFTKVVFSVMFGVLTGNPWSLFDAAGQILNA